MDKNGLAVEDQNTLILPEHYIRHAGIRLVKPYYFDFKCVVKRRMSGKTIIEVMSGEFPQRNSQYFEEAFQDGRLRIDGREISTSTSLQEGWVIRHFVHRHEPPVLDGKIQIVDDQQAELLAINKPSGMPVHVAGQYRKNTVLGVLQADNPKLPKLLPTHRLDKPVSGILLLATTTQKANELRTLFESRQLEKVYIARVKGLFPNEEMEVNTPLAWNPKTNTVYPAEDGIELPINCDSPKSASTKFRCMGSYDDGQTSLVECKPLTGRTHQIRVHLKHVGYPIANDAQYGGDLWGQSLFYDLRIKRGRDNSMDHMTKKKSRIEKATLDYVNEEAVVFDLNNSKQQDTQDEDKESVSQELQTQTQSKDSLYGFEYYDKLMQFAVNLEVPEDERDRQCFNCPTLMPKDFPLELRPLWLHAWKIKSDQFEFQSPLPSWAQDYYKHC